MAIGTLEEGEKETIPQSETKKDEKNIGVPKPKKEQE
jgi:hypothetical protein